MKRANTTLERLIGVHGLQVVSQQNCHLATEAAHYNIPPVTSESHGLQRKQEKVTGAVEKGRGDDTS